MKAALPLVALLAVFAAQWALPVGQIVRLQGVIEHGTPYRFRTAPVDPADPFRGRYVALRFAADRIAVPENADYDPDRRYYAPIAVADDGFAQLRRPLPAPPAHGDWLPVTVSARLDAGHVRVALPLDRFYLEEGLAPRAEALLRDAPETRAVWADVRVRDGRAVIAALVVDGEPVRRWLARRSEQ
ncbi:GDYXXLXY domain-containing protein [Algiphilus sp.]|uniref:GDYXXLXY domain-containing protein n=1 Tax=Algiphilus sp. TaxID=1872431 RepID=UPI0025C189BD|nr:GDYXXLXY domain-containing protein [Algiphilus sp.]MCK5769152.1 GDYXXLXY domain-containing protein [Algiphilus sp.]